MTVVRIAAWLMLADYMWRRNMMALSTSKALVDLTNPSFAAASINEDLPYQPVLQLLALLLSMTDSENIDDHATPKERDMCRPEPRYFSSVLFPF